LTFWEELDKLKALFVAYLDQLRIVDAELGKDLEHNIDIGLSWLERQGDSTDADANLFHKRIQRSIDKAKSFQKMSEVSR